MRQGGGSANHGREVRAAQTLAVLVLAAAIGIPPAKAQTYTETVLHNFASPPRGAYPEAGLIRDSAGNFYGTASAGGAAGAGVVFSLDTAGVQTVLYSFTGGVDGASPNAGVIRDAAGNLYGTTTGGGISSNGVVFKLDSTGNETVLYSFTGGADGKLPLGGLVRDSTGTLFGTTYFGGSVGKGVAFKLDTTGHETVLYSFTGGADGSNPCSGLVRDSAGNIYGTTFGGGASGWGTVFKLDATGHETVLYSFTGYGDGANPYAGLIRDAAGNLYGTTASGGTSGRGTVFKLDTTGNETILHNFTGNADGADPYAGLIQDSAGNLYGTTAEGGASNEGTVFKVDTTGRETVLYSFTRGADGGSPYGGLIRNSAGKLYGTTYFGGTTDSGLVFELDPTGHETVLYSFPASADGDVPYAGLFRDQAGNLYGTTIFGGGSGMGAVFEVDTAGRKILLYGFTGGADGAHPSARPIRDSAGNLYGTTFQGGASGWGVVYELDTTGHEMVLHSFTGYPDGALPYAGLIRDSAGNLYGTTEYGGANGGGLVFKVDATGHETLLYSFHVGLDGGMPYAGLIRDSAGNFYGTAAYGGAFQSGVVFELDSAGHEMVLHSFGGGADGANPYAGLIRDSAGNFYGTTYYGGALGAGVVFKLDTAGQETVLYSFTGNADGANPDAGLIRDSAGNLYGTTIGGGASGKGVVFALDTAGHETVLHSFTGSADGARPYAGLIRDAAGNLYGTSTGGGKRGGGVVFKLTP